MNDKAAYDIAIIGGGLAGLCLAIQGVNQGYKVIVFEKEEYPFNKVCGEYISLESWDFLESLNVPLTQWHLPLIKNLMISDAKGRQYSFNLPLGGFGVSRYLLDASLFKIAVAKGATILTKTKVTNVKFNGNIFNIETASGDHTATICTGTFGKRSNLDIKMKRPFVEKKPGKLNNYIGVKYHVKYPQEKGLISLHNFKNGYCGLSEIEDGKCCLCYLTTAANLKTNGNSIKVLEQSILMQNPQLKEIFNSADVSHAEPLVISQISFERKNQVENHILMLGDAAGLITPLCGNGMSMAMHSSKLAFKAVEKFFKNDLSRSQMEETYIIEWRKKFQTRLTMGRLVQRMFGGNVSTSLFLQSMKLFPLFSKWIIRSTHGATF